MAIVHTKLVKGLIASTAIVGVSACSVSQERLEPVDLRAFVEASLQDRYDQQAPVIGEIDLYEAMARAIKYNLDHHVRMFEVALAHEDYDLSRYDMLPDVVARAGWTTRSNEPGASSRSLITGTESLEPSQSTEKNTFTADLEASWSVLDFGLSYYRARQRADERLIATEMRRKIVNRIVEDVRTAYWRAVSAERLLTELNALEADAKRALENARTLAARRRVSPLSSTTSQRELILIQERAAELSTSLSTAKSQLATLMNLAPDAEFTLALPECDASPLRVEGSRADMIAAAFENRPEIREAAYRLRINGDEDVKAIIELMPNVNVFAGLRYDANDFLYNNSFADAGLRASWNLLRLVSLPQTFKRNEAREHLLRMQMAATAVAVMSQVDVANIRFAHLERELVIARDRNEVQRKILRQIAAGHRTGRISEQTYLRERMNTLIAEAEFDVAFADAQNAFANVFASIGVDPYGAEVAGFEDVATLSEALRRVWTGRETEPFEAPAPTPRPVAEERLEILLRSVAEEMADEPPTLLSARAEAE